MALLAPTSLIGTIEVDTTNNKVYWSETDGVTPVSLSVTISSGTYWPDSSTSAESIIQTIADDMTTESGSSGYNGTYTATFDKSNGSWDLDVSGGTVVAFRLMMTATETSKLLTGGDATAGEQGLDSLGYVVDSSYPSYLTGFTSDTQISNCWFPAGPVNQTTISGKDYAYASETVQTKTLGGSTISRCFTPRTPVTSVDYHEILTLTHEFLSDTDRTNYQQYFWSCYAKTGAKFRFHADRTDLSTFVLYQLWMDSAQGFEMERLPGYPHFSLNLPMKRWKE